MSNNPIAIKPNNHRVYQCVSEKKLELLNKIIAEHPQANILVACSQEPQTIIDALENKNITVIEDRVLIKEKELSCEFLISFDLPIKNIVYMARLAKATNKAIILLNESEQAELYQIERLLGRALKQESIEGFAYPKAERKEETFGKKPLTKVQIKEIAKQRYEEKTGDPQEKTFDKKPKREYDDEEKKSYDKNGKKNNFNKSDSNDKWAKKKKAPNKFLGKDENGKAIFSGKSGDRNHHYNGTPKARKTINITARKPKEDEK